MIALIPYIREALRRHLSAKQAVMLTEFDKLKRDYQEHQYEIHAKLVAIMNDRLVVHCKSLQTIDWTVERAAGVNSYMETLVKETATLHKVLAKYLHGPTLDQVIGQVLSDINARLADEYGKIELKDLDAKARMLIDARFLQTKLAELKGLTRPTPGQVCLHCPLPARDVSSHAYRSWSSWSSRSLPLSFRDVHLLLLHRTRCQRLKCRLASRRYRHHPRLQAKRPLFLPPPLPLPLHLYLLPYLLLG